MAHVDKVIPEERELRPAEKALVQWLLEHGNEQASQYLPQLSQAKVISRCPCGCASVNFSIGGKSPTDHRLTVLSDFQWQDQQGHLFGVFAFSMQKQLAGIELWSIDGLATASEIPPVEQLVPFGTPAQ